MARGKNINMFLMDGTATGRIKCTIANWTGVVYRIPRTEIENCKNRNDLKQSGVYFLFGTSSESGKPAVYIGQAGNRKNGEGILNRLFEHKRNSEKNYWSEAVVLTTSNNSFGPTEISFLENKFCNLAVSANRYEVKNGNDPSPGHITEEKESELEEFAEFARIIMGTLGHNVFEPVTEIISVAKNSGGVESDEPIFYLSRKLKVLNNKLVEASCKVTAQGYKVLKGSYISPKADELLAENVKNARKNAKISSENILLEDMAFSYPSPAATFVIGKPADGWTSWKTKDGMTLKEFEKISAQ